ncbi:MAG: HAD-IIA family hydrolase [Nitrososphaeria archaeon]
MRTIQELFNSKDLFLLDGDGTMYIGNRPTPGAREFLLFLDRIGKRHIIITNNSSYSTSQHARRISKILNYRVKDNDVLVSTSVTIKYILDRGIRSVYALGMPAFREEVKRHGIRLDYLHPELVLIAFDRTLTYRKLSVVTKLIMSGVPYIATHPDILCPVTNGYIPDIGAILAFIETATGKRPEAILGKPNRLMVDYALEMAKTSIDRAVLFGDRLYTDIRMANEAGMTSVLVLTGETKEVERSSSYSPDFIIGSFDEIMKS